MNDRFIQWLTIEWKTKFQNLFFLFENHQCHMCLHLCWQFSVQHPLTNRRLSMSTVMMPSTLIKFKGHLEEKTNPSVSPRCFFTPHAHYSRIFILNPILIWPDPTVTANANLADSTVVRHTSWKKSVDLSITSYVFHGALVTLKICCLLKLCNRM